MARTAAAAGLFSSWVSPADNRPSDSSRSRCPMMAWLERKPMVRPSSRCIAIGNHSRNFSPNSSAPITQKSQSVTARTELQYGTSAMPLTNDCVAPE